MTLALPVAAAPKPSRRLVGNTQPRISPPRPVRSEAAAFEKTALSIGIELMPWQKVASRYLMARGADGKRPYREVAIVVARQQGKTTLMKPLIIHALRSGRRVVHIANDRNLPRHMFDLVADVFAKEPEGLPKRRGRTIWPRYGAGQEEIILLNGGSYRIAASRTGGARGWSNDVVIIDELREMESFDVINAAEPTLMMSPDPLMVYLSNAGTDRSIVLNSVRERASEDTGLAYLEWSADPGLDPGDRKGWVQANPALGHHAAVQANLEAAYTRHRLANTMPIFETENLCRSVDTMLPRVVSAEVWAATRQDTGTPVRPVMGIAQDPNGRRASAVIAWKTADDIVNCHVLADVVGYPVDLEGVAEDVQKHARKMGIRHIAFDPFTDRDWARFFKDPVGITAGDYAAACDRFARVVEAGQLRCADVDGVLADDIAYTVQKPTPHGWIAVRASDERPTTASLAAIRAVWLATNPAAKMPRVY